MKNFAKYFFTLALMGFLFSFAALPLAVAATPDEVIKEKTGDILDDILPRSVVKDIDDPNKTIVPTEDLKMSIIPRTINILLGFVGSISFGIFVYAGVMLIIAQGKEEEITKFKNILVWSIVGLLFVTTAYGIVRGVMTVVFN